MSSRHTELLCSARSGRVGAWLIEENGRLVLRKRLSAARHMLQRPPAWALDEAVLQQALAAGAVEAHIEDTDSGFPLNRGHGPQVALTLNHWHVESPDAPHLPFGEGGP